MDLFINNMPQLAEYLKNQTPYVEEVDDSGKVIDKYLYRAPAVVEPPQKKVTLQPLMYETNRHRTLLSALGIFTPILIAILLFTVNEINFLVKLFILIIVVFNTIILIQNA